MDSLYEFELLNIAHDISNFRSSAECIDGWFRSKAAEETAKDISRTYVLIDREADNASNVICFSTLSADSFWFESRKIPLVELQFLARHVNCYGSRIGSVLLVEALRCASEASNAIGIEGVWLSATTEGRQLYARFPFEPHPNTVDNCLLIHINRIRELLSAANSI